MTPLSLIEYNVALRQDFPTFLERCFREVVAGSTFIPNWHLAVIAAKLDAVRRGEIRRLIINVPPRSLKSLCASVAFPAWILGRDPTAQVLCASYAQDLSEKFARDGRTIMSSGWYGRAFPTRLSRQRQAVADFVTTAGGRRYAASVGGPLTGRGADIIIIDDPLNLKRPSRTQCDGPRTAGTTAPSPAGSTTRSAASSS